MNLVNFFTYDKNKSFVRQVKDYTNDQGCYKSYNLILEGNGYNKYLITTVDMTIVIDESFVLCWEIGQFSASDEYDNGPDSMEYELEFLALGKITDYK